jgi:hypothetical protein
MTDARLKEVTTRPVGVRARRRARGRARRAGVGARRQSATASARDDATTRRDARREED